MKKKMKTRKTISIKPLNMDVIIGGGTVTTIKERPVTKDERTGPGQLMIHTITIDLTGKMPEVQTETLSLHERLAVAAKRKSKKTPESKIIKMKNGSEEIVLIERGGYQVRAPLYESGISPEYIRVVDTTKRGKELAYWSHREFMESKDPFDPSTALAAAFSVIELVYSGQYPPRGT